MKKNLILGLASLALVLSGTVVFAKNEGNASPGRNGVLNQEPNAAHLYLWEKNPADWKKIDGAWGLLSYDPTGTEFKFVFNGHNLEKKTEYSLIYYPDPWPGNGLICLGEGTSNNGGNVHIMGSVNTGDLPASYDENYTEGAKIWLVLSDDLNCGNSQMIGWNPEKYLFENNLIKFEDTNQVWIENKDELNDWAIIVDEQYGSAEYNLNTGSDYSVNLSVQGLEANTWYFIGVDKKDGSCSWVSQLNDGNDPRYYKKSDDEGYLKMSFNTELSEYSEFSLKDPEWANDSGNWVYAGGSWNYLMSTVNTIPLSCTY